MKKWLRKVAAVLLALTLILCVGCGDQSGQDSVQNGTEDTETSSNLFYDLTGIAPHETVMTVNGHDISAEQYFYWVAYNCSSLEYNIGTYYTYYGMYTELVNSDDGSILWDVAFQNGQTLEQYALEEAEATIKFYVTIEEMAEKYSAGLDTEDNAAMVEALTAAIEELGGQEEFDKYLARLGICQDSFNQLSATGYLFDNLLLQVMEEGNELYLPDEDYNNYATYADHILLAIIDLDSGDALNGGEVEEKRALAEDLLAQLRASDDPVSLFDQLADEYSEDTGRATNPTGYIYTPGSMVQPFENAASALEPGQISDIVESDYGFHIILRRDLLEGLKSDPEQKVAIAEQHLTSVLGLISDEATVARDERLNAIDIGDFYTSYVEAVNAMYLAENAPDTTEDPAA